MPKGGWHGVAVTGGYNVALRHIVLRTMNPSVIYFVNDTLLAANGPPFVGFADIFPRQAGEIDLKGKAVGCVT